ncbi:MAG: alcohol dehydrogenase catalytic domain-containing protein [Clostridiales bacterium]|nr:alcohol dehydrogenase catalytic domain-containing protein [Clostridiales bacterium]
MENEGVVIEAPGCIRVKELPVQKPACDELLVRVKYVAVCGSDKKLFSGTYAAPHKYPVIIGHEWVGEVVEAGSGAAGFKAGDVITGDCSLFCGECENCLRNDRNHCKYIEKRGITQDGGCAKYITVNRRHVYRCPELPDIKALALTEPLAVSVVAVVNRIPAAEIKAFRNALIIGAGGIGSLCIFALLEQGIPRISISDFSSAKLAVVDSLGFDNVKTIKTDLIDCEIPTGASFDLVVEAAGSPAALKKAVELVASNGKIVCIGHQKQVDLDFGLVMKKSVSIITSIGSTGGFETAIDILGKHWGNIGKLISRIVPMDETAHYFENHIDDLNDIKVLVDLN